MTLDLEDDQHLGSKMDPKLWIIPQAQVFGVIRGVFLSPMDPQEPVLFGAICEPWLAFLESVRNLTLCNLCHWLHVPFETDSLLGPPRSRTCCIMSTMQMKRTMRRQLHWNS